MHESYLRSYFIDGLIAINIVPYAVHKWQAKLDAACGRAF